MNIETQYEKLYNRLLQGLEQMHNRNIRRTRNVLKSLIIIPTIFLILLFFSGSSEFKTIFLVLWIVSMFAIAAVLIVIEYQDYQLRNIFKELDEIDMDSEESDVTPALRECDKELLESIKSLSQENAGEPFEYDNPEEITADDIPEVLETEAENNAESLNTNP